MVRRVFAVLLCIPPLFLFLWAMDSIGNGNKVDARAAVTLLTLFFVALTTVLTIRGPARAQHGGAEEQDRTGA